MFGRSKFAGLALLVSLAVPVWFMVAALGVKFGLWPWRLGLGVLIVQWGPRLLIASAVIAGVALIAVLIRKPRRGWQAALIALLIPALGFGYMGWVRSQSADIPPIHDVATDIVDPPTPGANLLALRTADEANPVLDMTAPLTAAEAYQGPRFARFGELSLGRIGHEAYPAVRTREVAAPPAAAFAAAREAARSMGWTPVNEDEAGGVIEATAETFWFGFKDDVIIRVRPTAGGEGALIDVRSISRVGLSDLGANAKRIETFLSRVEIEQKP
ncbi:MAG: DUF1499 domain-containing protein [Burkholderiales bacterium]|nr:DUF1499 domain-containing protein [Burkholderiales bacterium]